MLLYIGRISKEKNLVEILQGLQEYLPRHPNVKFLLVGDGPNRKNIQSLTHSLGMESQVMFAGEKPWERIGLYYQLGDVFISASQSETQGLTFIEALAAGLPLIARADPCLDHVLDDGVNGFAFTDKSGFLSALEAALSNDTILQNMSNAAIRSAETFTAEAFARSVEGVYKETLLYREEARCLHSICDHQQTV